MLLAYLFILGTAIGSFLNVLIDRLPQDKPITGRSHCDHCKKTLQPLDLVPVVSFIFLKGKCRYCHAWLSPMYPFIEILTGTAFLLVWLYAPVDTVLLKSLYIGIISTLIVIFFADLKYQIIPDQMQLTLLLLSVGVVGVQGGQLLPHILSGLAVMAFLLFLFLATKGRGMGFGDVKLAFILGFLLGTVEGYLALYIAFITGAVYGVGVVVSGNKTLKSRVAFGPFIVLSMVAVLFFGDTLRAFIQPWYRF